MEFTGERIREAIALGRQEGFSLVPSADLSGHGTAVAAIAAGSGTDRRYIGAAPGASLLIVKLGQAGSGSYPRTTQLMRAMAYALQKAQELGMPLAVNLSFGNSYGAHDGSSLLERDFWTGRRRVEDRDLRRRGKRGRGGGPCVGKADRNQDGGARGGGI